MKFLTMWRESSRIKAAILIPPVQLKCIARKNNPWCNFHQDFFPRKHFYILEGKCFTSLYDIFQFGQFLKVDACNCGTVMERVISPAPTLCNFLQDSKIANPFSTRKYSKSNKYLKVATHMTPPPDAIFKKSRCNSYAIYMQFRCNID